ncbi:MAG: GxxExxY protein [Planctomycetota bacterium]
MHDDNGRGRGRGRGGDRKATPLSDLDPALTEVSRKSIGCAIEVHMALGPGHSADAYRNALKAELESQGIGVVVGKAFAIEYKGNKVGESVSDLEVGERFLLMVLSRAGDLNAERSMLRAQLRAADMELGLIMNFAERRMTDGLVRVLNPNKLNANKSDGGHGGDHDDEHADEDAPMAAPPEVQG